MIPVSDGPFGPVTTAARAADPVVRRYRALFADLDWTQVPERDPRRPWPGSPPHPRAAYIKALLVKLSEGKSYVTEVRAFLLDHPLLVLDLGFRPVLDGDQPFGFDVERTLPGVRWLRHQQQTLDRAILSALLTATVQALRGLVPAWGTTVAIDVKHLYAWVRENNPKETIRHRCDPARQPRGDPDCRLGAKQQSNQDGRKTKTFLWGYGSGIAAATDPHFGDVVLAEWTQPFNHQDITWFHPVYRQTVATLGGPPPNLAADAAFDAWYVYQACADHGGIAAIAPNRRGPTPARDPDGTPRCDRDLAMAPGRQYRHEDGYQAREYRCPLRGPTASGARCDDPRFAHGGCYKRINLEHGAQLRRNLDRTAASYRTLYCQRTSAERINSQAVALGLERPKVRRLAAVHRLATLTYILINLRAIHRTRRRLPHAPPIPPLC